MKKSLSSVILGIFVLTMSGASAWAVCDQDLKSAAMLVYDETGMLISGATVTFRTSLEAYPGPAIKQTTGELGSATATCIGKSEQTVFAYVDMPGYTRAMQWITLPDDPGQVTWSSVYLLKNASSPQPNASSPQ